MPYLKKIIFLVLLLGLMSCSAYQADYYHRPVLNARFTQGVIKAKLITITNRRYAYYNFDLYLDIWITGDYESLEAVYISVDGSDYIKLPRKPYKKRVNIPKAVKIKNVNNYVFTLEVKLKIVLIDLDGKEQILEKTLKRIGRRPNLMPRQ